ncbi:MAG: ribosome biogenesis GTP-binding protein YihA/YsxC [Longimicrobiales bacterium]
MGALAQPGGWRPPALPQVAFSGRSNVGKSSLINRFLGRTRTAIARVSATPGKTQQINFFAVRAALTGGQEHHFYVVDLPGYGFARAPGPVRKAWRPLIESYLSGTPELKGVVQLVDVRHDPTTDDLHMVEYLSRLGLPTLFVLTKVDKLSATQRPKRIERALEVLNIEAEQALPFSAHSGEGREALLASVQDLLA